MPMRRFRVEERSMLPTLAPGDEVAATDSSPPAVGHLVVVPHPGRRDFWLVKRLAAAPGGLAPGGRIMSESEAWVVSDSPAGTDSTIFGPVDWSAVLAVVERIDEVTFGEAVDLLASEDEAFAGVITTYGAPRFWRRPPGFATLTLAVLEQQVTLESGAAMFARLRGEVGRVDPEAILHLGTTGLSRLGVTRQKSAYLVGLAKAAVEGTLDLEALTPLPAAEARARLLAHKGIGPWTADVYLLSALLHPDVFPVTDRALQVGTAEMLGLASPSRMSDLSFLSQPWRPLRAAAARVIWHGYLARRGRAEPAVAGLFSAPAEDA